MIRYCRKPNTHAFNRCSCLCNRYDGGNYLRIAANGQVSNYLQYTACGATRSAGVGDIQYSTCWANGYFTVKFTSGAASITGFYVTGNASSLLIVG